MGIGRGNELCEWWRSVSLKEEGEAGSGSFRFAVVAPATPGKLVAVSLLPLLSPSSLSFPLSLFLGGLGGFVFPLRFSTLLLVFIDLFFDSGGMDRLSRNSALGVLDPDPEATLSIPGLGAIPIPALAWL